MNAAAPTPPSAKPGREARDERFDGAAMSRYRETPAGAAISIGNDQLRAIKVCLLILTTAALLGIVYFAKAVLMPATFAVVLAVVLRPIVGRLRRWGVPSVVTATLLFTLVLGLAIFATVTLAEPVQKWLRDAPRTIGEVQARLEGHLEPITQLMNATEEVEKTARRGDPDRPVAVQLEQPALSSELLSTTGSYATSVVITLALLFLLLVLGDRFLEKTVQIVPTWRGKREVVETMREVEHRISLYLGSITLINAGLGLTIGAGLYWIGLPNAVLWGVLAALLNYIPFAGLAAGTLLVSFAGLAAFDNLAHASLAPLIYLGANGIEANIVTPLLLGRSIDLNPVVILLSVMLGGWLWGMLGIFLALPLLIIVKIICESQEATRPVAVYLAN